MRFLAHCLPHVERSDHPTEDAASVTWQSLLHLARWHGVTPLLAARALRPSPVAPPPFALTELQTDQQRQLLISLTAVSALVELQQAFDRHGIKVLSWKGPSAGLLLFGSASLRESADLDFIFLDKDLAAIQQITAELGYLGQKILDEKDRYEFNHQHEFSFVRPRDRMVLEFHSQIMTSRFSAWQDSHTYVERANIRLPLAGHHLLLQCPEDLLVSLCVHAMKHNWDRLKWSCDVAMFLQLYGRRLDWTRYLSELAKTGKHSVVLFGLALAAELFELRLPDAVLRLLEQSPAVPRLAGLLSRHLMSSSTGPIPREEASQLVALLCPSAYDRLVYVLNPIIRLEYEDLYIPRPSSFVFFLNYPYRFWRLLRRHGLSRLVSMIAAYIRSVR